MDSIEVKVWRALDGEGDYSALIYCPAFTDREDGFGSVTDALLWASDRLEKSANPFLYVE
jgi:hypothetical protein